MFRILLAIIFIFYTIVPAYSETENAESGNIKPAAQVKEKVKINAQIKYDDDEIETIYLDNDIEKPQVDIPNRSITLPAKVLNITTNTNSTRSALARSMINRGQVTDILPLYASITETYYGFSYGQIWEQDLSYSQIEDTTAFFLRYDFPKWFSLTASIRQSANQDIGTQYNTLRISPEWHITKRLTIRDSYTAYMNLPKNKNEITLIYTPSLQKFADALKFEMGYADSYYNSGRHSSAVSFSTGFKL